MARTLQIRLLTIDLSFHRAASGVIRSVLARHGVDVTETLAPHAQAFEQLHAGAADMLCSAWLPDSHGVYFAPMASRFEKVAVLYRPYAYWGVPDDVPQALVSSIEDLRKPEVAARMHKRIQGIGAGAGISRFSRTAMTQYGLAEAGYHFENGTLDDCVAAYEHAVQHGRWVVLPLWKPQFLHEQYAIRPLQDPLGVMGGADEATLVARHEVMHRLPAEAASALRSTSLGNDAVSRLDYLVSRDRVDPLEAARRWLHTTG
ncbi:glycine betaine ABC transporter substrate-binding protein [Xanthomonas sp. CFBP 8445]|uniref:glycine betaine ABC transporter substrate-binding protein n=2 Tax=Xanthomonas TaxID=338 RepID=UPI0021DF76A8|nr:glycine betaine ABC transporter substrate-binding protein [Xanthomonas sp. CFBP 8445]UYC13975.1 glycine betaine ABC transporter substrate-binding protein [Xanthomonas sp. CFBP 8445]